MARERLPGWPGDRLTALAEQASVFYAIVTPELMDLVRCIVLPVVRLDVRGDLVRCISLQWCSAGCKGSPVMDLLVSILTPKLLDLLRCVRCVAAFP